MLLYILLILLSFFRLNTKNLKSIVQLMKNNVKITFKNNFLLTKYYYFSNYYYSNYF